MLHVFVYTSQSKNMVANTRLFAADHWWDILLEHTYISFYAQSVHLEARQKPADEYDIAWLWYQSHARLNQNPSLNALSYSLRTAFKDQDMECIVLISFLFLALLPTALHTVHSAGISVTRVVILRFSPRRGDTLYRFFDSSTQNFTPISAQLWVWGHKKLNPLTQIPEHKRPEEAYPLGNY